MTVNSKEFFVVGPDNLTSWSDKTESAERFKSIEAATKRAKELAECEPGEEFVVCQVVRRVACPVGKPAVT